MLYAKSKQGPSNRVLNSNVVTCLEKQLKAVQIDGQMILFLHSDKPYYYLGVEITASLNWTHPAQKVKQSMLEKGKGS